MPNHIQNEESQKVKKEKHLFSEFPVPTYEEWREVAEKTLKGTSFEKKLITKTYEGISIQPIYRREDIEGLPYVSSSAGTSPYLRGNSTAGYQEKPWKIAQELLYRTPEEFNQAACHDLKRGQTMLNLVLDKPSALGQDPDQTETKNIGNGGVSVCSVHDIKKVFENISLEDTPFLIQAGAAGLPIYSMMIVYAREQGIDISKLRGCVGMDPLGTLSKSGTMPFSGQRAYQLMADYTLWAEEKTPLIQTILVQGNPYHDAGGSADQELAFALATGVEYVRELLTKDLSIETITKRMLFSFSVGSNFFMEIAKLRAARLLWSQMISAFGGSEAEQKMLIHARTSAWTKTMYDPYVNMLRGTSEAFSAILGGIDSLHVSSFDEAVRPADDFSRRIAKNTQLILEKEAHLAKVVDPAGGSWYLESLTNSLAQQAWKLFQKVEGQGGMFTALTSGFVQEQIAQVASQRAKNIGSRKDKFVGTNMYPNMKEAKLALSQKNNDRVIQTRMKEMTSYKKMQDQSKKDTWSQALNRNSDNLVESSIQGFELGLTLGEWTNAICQTNEPALNIQPLQIERATEAFERLRKQAEAYKEKHGAYEKVFLANIGPIPQHKPRADFATGFFEVGGFEVIANNGFETVEQAVQAALESKASIVVICSNDESYPKLVPALATLLKQANPDITLFLAGLPDKEQAIQYQEAGVDEFIHLRSNCFEVLSNLQEQKGVG